MATNVIPAVLLLTYRRENTTRQVIEALRKVEAPAIYFAADAPKQGEERACQAVRDLVKTIDWECKIETNFRIQNKGLRDAVESSIGWFFDHVDEGIILEDDCVPNADFFSFCSELLKRYRDSDRVMHISGNNHDRSPLKDSYRFSNYPHIWGWATWAKAWKRNQKIERDELKDRLAKRFENPHEQKFWLLLNDCVESGKIDTWDFPWLFSLVKENGICISPQQNLVTNVGFGPDATHTTQENHVHANAAVSELTFPLTHPQEIKIDVNRDIQVADDLYQIGDSARTRHAKLHFTKVLPRAAKRWLKNQFSK